VTKHDQGPDDTVAEGLADYIAQHRDVFAGSWIDRTTGDKVVAFTDDVEMHRQHLAEHLPPSSRVRVTQREHAWTDLLALQAQIDAAADRLCRQGADITMTGCDPIRGGVVVGLLELTEEARAVVSELFPSPMIIVEHQDRATLL
jgi:hypothetical protein